MPITSMIPAVVERNGIPMIEFTSGHSCEVPSKTAGILCARGWHLYEALADMVVMFAPAAGEMPSAPDLQMAARKRAQELLQEITSVARQDKGARPLPGRLGIHN